MPRKKKNKKPTGPVITDIVFEPLGKDEEGKEIFKKKSYSGRKLVKEEVVTEAGLR